MRITEVDPLDDAAFRAWFDVLHAVEQDQRPGEAGWGLDEQRAMALATDSGEEVRLWTAALDGRVVAMARLVVPVHDNLDTGRCHVMVLPGERRRGVGSALVDHVAATARDLGRTTLTFELDERPELMGRSPGRRFAEARGMRCALPEVRRDLRLPVDPQRLADCRAEAAPADAYRLVRLGNCLPEEHVEHCAALFRAMSTMFPSGDLELEEEAWDADRVRAADRLLEAQDRDRFGALAMLGDEPAGYTFVARPRAVPARAFQWDTLVLPEHRGRRLGLRLKLEVLDQLQAASPPPSLLSTWNAEVNAPMIAVNEALGFEVNGTLSTWQLRI